MKLYYSPGACSLSPHIVLREAGLPFEMEKVNLQEKRTERGVDYRTINPKGYVPALQLDEGGILTEGPAVVQYLADRAPDKRLAPPPASFERYRLQEWLNFITAELHKGFSPLFNPKLPEETKVATRERLAMRFEYVANALEGDDFIFGNGFSVADAYLFTVLRWSKPLKVDTTRWPALLAYLERIASRPAVREAIKVEGIPQ